MSVRPDSCGPARDLRWTLGVGSGPRRRAVVRLDPRAAAGYGRAVAAVAVPVEAALGPEVLANRAVGRGRLSTARLEPWRPARARWEAAMLAPRDGLVVATDVRDCYGSIGPEAVDRALGRRGVSRHDRRRVASWLESAARAGIAGLPVGPPGSAILANAALCELDEALRALPVRHVRWVDDIVVFARDRVTAEAALDALREAVGDFGGSLNDAKTSITEVLAGSRAIPGPSSLSRAEDVP